MIAGGQTWRLWKGPVILWIILLCLLAVSTASAYWPLGAANTALNLLFAAAMIALLVSHLMDLRNATALIRIVAVAGLFWSMFLFALTFADYCYRYY